MTIGDKALGRERGEPVRFFIVALLGLGIDIGIAWALIAFLGTGDALAAITGFSVATVVNYLAHQFWTFGESGQGASLSRFAGFVGVVLVTLTVRLATLHLLAPMLPGSGINAPLRLGLAAGVSFIVSFLLNKYLVFGRRGKDND